MSNPGDFWPKTWVKSLDTWDTDYIFDNWEQQYEQLHCDPWIKSDGDSIRNSCDVFWTLPLAACIPKNVLIFGEKHVPLSARKAQRGGSNCCLGNAQTNTNSNPGAALCLNVIPRASHQALTNFQSSPSDIQSNLLWSIIEYILID